MQEKYDFVKIVDADDEFRSFVGQEGMVIEVDENYEYPYEVVFFNKEYQKICIEHGGILWRETDIDGI